MAWDLDRGPRLDTLLRREKEGRDVPELLDRPVLTLTETFLMDVFESVSTERAFGMAVGPIPHSAVCNYALRNSLDADTLHEMWIVVRELDAQRMESMTPKSGKNKGGQDGRLPHQDSDRPVRRGRRKSGDDA